MSDINTWKTTPTEPWTRWERLVFCAKHGWISSVLVTVGAFAAIIAFAFISGSILA